MKCFIYRNLNRKGFVYSFKALEGPYKGRVVAYGESFEVESVKFFVSQAGWKRAVREKKRNVHAGIIGNVTVVGNYVSRLPNNTLRSGVVAPLLGGFGVRYHPFETNGSFVGVNTGVTMLLPIYEAQRVVAYRNIVRATNVT